MVKFLIKVLAIFSLTACSNHRPEIQLIDLKFPAIDKEGALSNTIDTTFLISEFNSKTDTVGVIIYDSLGRILIDASDPWNTYWYKYDSSGIVKSRKYRQWDVYLRFNSTYQYLNDSLLLIQNWPGDYSYTTRYKFNLEGLLIEEFTDDSDFHGDSTRRVKTIFEYNHDNKLVRKIEKLFLKKALDTETTCIIFYTNKRIDSVVTTVNSQRWGQSKTVDHYDINGLRRLTIKTEPDTVLPKIKYIHKKKNDNQIMRRHI